MRLWQIKNKNTKGNIFECNNIKSELKKLKEQYLKHRIELDNATKTEILLKKWIIEAKENNLNVLAENISKSYNSNNEFIAKLTYLIDNYNECGVYKIITNEKGELEENFVCKLNMEEDHEQELK